MDPLDARPKVVLSDTDAASFIEDLVERSQVITDLSMPAVGGFVSSLLDITESEGVTGRLIEALAGHHDNAFVALAWAALGELADEPHASRARMLADQHATPGEVASVVASRLDAAWLVTAPFGRSLLTAWTTAADEQHGVMFELAEHGALHDLVLVEDPRALVDDLAATPELEIHELTSAQATARCVESWNAAVAGSDPFGPSLEANQRLVRRLLERAGTEPMVLFDNRDAPIDLTRGMTPDEIVEANAAARSTLRAAVGDAPGADALHAWVACVRGTVEDLTARQQAGLLWLEWADWLGVGIGLLRAGAGAPMHGEALVDLVNRCPEVSSSIDASDREYAAWAFDLVVEHLSDAGVVEAGALTERGHSTLHDSLVAAWSDPAPESGAPAVDQ